MQAVRIHPAASGNIPYSVTNPAPFTALHLDTIDVPQPKNANEIVVKIQATTIIRDTLTWPEMYAHPYAIPGHDFAGIVHAIHSDSNSNSEERRFKVGDQVYGMVHADRGECWAEYVIVRVNECCLKPPSLSWQEAATVPLSALTAWQALFRQAGVPQPDILSQRGDRGAANIPGEPDARHKVLITGASGGVGVWLVQLAKLAGCYVVAGTTSKSRSAEFLEDLGADEVAEYDEIFAENSVASYDTIIDGVGGLVLENCWSVVKDNGSLVSIHSDSFEFVENHQRSGVSRGKEGVKALFFIVEASGSDLAVLSALIESGKLRTFVGEVFALSDVQKAYDVGHGKAGKQGKIVLIPDSSA